MESSALNRPAGHPTLALASTAPEQGAPEPLKSLDQWVMWKYVDGAKVPHTVRGYRASTTTPSNWTSYENAAAALAGGGFDGVGFVFSKSDEFVGIDLDDCVTDGVVDDWAQEIIDDFGTYAEISPSGTGVKMYGRGALPCTGTRRTGKKKSYGSGEVEMYQDARYFCFTGQQLDLIGDVNDCQAAIDNWWPKVYGTMTDRVETGSEDELDAPDVTPEEMDRHRQYLATLDDAVAGNDGHKCFFLACKAIRRLRLNADQSRELVDWFNENKCEPSFDEDDVQHKWREAKRNTEIIDPTTAFPPVTEEERERAERDQANAAATPPKRKHRIDLQLKTPEEFVQGQENITYLVDGVLATEGGFILGGPAKCLKTAIAVDLCYSIASGSPFLGHFDVPERKKVAFFTAETAPAAIYNRLTKIQEFRGGAGWGDRLLLSRLSPQLSEDEWINELKHAINDLEVDFCLIDPAYWAVFNQDTAQHAANANIVGRILHDYSSCGLFDRPCTMGLCHHLKKGVKTGEKPGLHQLTGSGYGEWLRQGIMLNRRSMFRMDGRHHLFMEVSGTAGFCSSYDVDVDEGHLKGRVGGRWAVEITNNNDPAEAFESDEPVLTPAEEKILDVLSGAIEPLTNNSLRDGTQITNDVQLKKALKSLIDKGLCLKTSAVISGRKRDVYELPPKDEDIEGEFFEELS